MMSSEEVSEIKNEEATAPIVNEVLETTNEEQPTEQIKEEETITSPIEQTKKEEREAFVCEQPTAKAKTKTKSRTVKVVELVECDACKKKCCLKV